MRNVEWHRKYIAELPVKLNMIRTAISLCSGPRLKIAVIHMTAPLDIIRTRVRRREFFGVLKTTNRPHEIDTISSAAKRVAGAVIRDNSVIHMKGRVVPPQVLAASLKMHHFSSLLPFSCNLLISLDVSQPTLRIIYPWHFSWVDFTVEFASGTLSTPAVSPLKTGGYKNHGSPNITMTATPEFSEIITDNCSTLPLAGDLHCQGSTAERWYAGRKSCHMSCEPATPGVSEVDYWYFGATEIDQSDAFPFTRQSRVRPTRLGPSSLCMPCRQ